MLKVTHLRWEFLMNCWIFLAAWCCLRWEYVRLKRHRLQ